MRRLVMQAWASVAVVTAALMAPYSYAAAEVGACGTIRLAETAVAMLSNQPIVSVFANSAAVLLLLDTGAEATVLTPAAAQRIGAQRARAELSTQMHGITGDIPSGELELRSFTIGGVEVLHRRVRVAPIEIVNPSSGLLDGVLGADTLSSFDIDLDLPGRRMTLYQRQSCAAAWPVWAQPYARIAAGRSPTNRLIFPVQLDGRRISALFDTGAQFSVLSTRTALALRVNEALLARDPPVTVRGAEGEQLIAHVHRFIRLEVDGEVIRNAEIDVTEISLNEADLVLGIDFLASRRVWISYGSQLLFLMYHSAQSYTPGVGSAPLVLKGDILERPAVQRAEPTDRQDRIGMDAGRPTPCLSILILPFANFSNNPEQEYIADGVVPRPSARVAKSLPTQ